MALLRSVPVVDGEPNAVLGGLAEFVTLLTGDRSDSLDRVAEEMVSRAPPEQQWFLVGSEPLDDSDDPVGKALAVARPHLDALRLATGQWTPSLTHEQLYEIHLRYDDSPQGLLGEMQVVLVESARTQEPKVADDNDIAAASRLADWAQLDDPTITAMELLLGSSHDLDLLGDYQSSILKAAIGVEMTVTHMAMMLEWEAEGRPLRLPKALRAAKPLRLAEVLARRLPNSTWDPSDPATALGRWRDRVARIRNAIMHTGYRPSASDADQCHDATVEVSGFLRSALMEAAPVAPWTLLKWSTSQLMEAGTLEQTQRTLQRADGASECLDDTHRHWLAAYLAAIR